MRYRLTGKEFSIFKNEFRKWQAAFGLHRYEIFYQMHKSDEDGMAWCSTNQSGCIATISLARSWEPVKPTAYALKKAAFHECVELLISNISEIAEARYVTRQELDEERHRIVRSLEYVIFDKGQPKA